MYGPILIYEKCVKATGSDSSYTSIIFAESALCDLSLNPSVPSGRGQGIKNVRAHAELTKIASAPCE
jgi:hypothetical protein